MISSYSRQLSNFLFFIFVLSSTGLYRSKDVFSCFILHSNEFLEKSGNVLIEEVDDVNECLRKCMQAPLYHKIRCQTVMYNVNTKNCVLSKYKREERKVKKSKGLQIDLYENGCAQENETIRLGVFNEQTRTTALPFTVKSIKMVPTFTTTSTLPTTNELRRVHAVKQYPLDQAKESAIYSKTVIVDSKRSSTTSRQTNRKNRQRTKHAKIFQSPRPLVDSTSLLQLETSVQNTLNRKQRSDKSLENVVNCFQKTANRVLAKFEEEKITGVTLENCIRQCAQSSAFYCASLNYNFNLKLCILNGGNVHLNDEQLIQSRDYDYYENICQPKKTTTPKSTSGTSTRKECYRLYNNSIYNSFDATIVGGLSDLESCELECSWSHIRRREKCLAVNWIGSSKGCMLFHKPIDYNTLVPSFKSIFLVNVCSYSTDETQSTKTSDKDYYD